MPTSVLETIKKMLGIDSENTDFDIDVLVFINENLSVLYQLGVLDAPVDATETLTWSDLTGSFKDINMIQTEIYLAVRTVFDPPTNASVLESYNKRLAELQFRLKEQCDPVREEV